MSKTKEQIMEDEYKKLIMNWEKAYQQSPSIFKAAHSAMDEYAKQQVIDFNEWKDKINERELYDSKGYKFSYSQLYDIFLQSQSQ